MPKVKNKELSQDFLMLGYTVKKVCGLNKKQEDMFNLLVSMVKKGDYSECQASFVLGLLVAKGEEGIKEVVKKKQEALRKEVEEGGK